MDEKQINTRIQLKYDTLSAWNNATVAGKGANLVLKIGEIGIVAVPSGSSHLQTVPPAIMFKVGDGVSAFKDLPWASALSADVFAWAKKQVPDVKDFSDIITAARSGLISADSVVKTLNGLKGDITVVGDNEGYISITKDEQTIQINLNFADDEQNALASGITATKVSKYDGYEAKITAAKTQADKGVTDAAAASTKADNVLGTNSDASSAATVYGARALAKEGKDAAAAAQSTADAALPKTDFETFKGTNTTAIADAKKAGTDAAAALESYKTTNDAAVSKNATDISNLQDAVKAGITFKGKVDSLPAVTNYSNGDLIIVGTKEYILYDSGTAKSWIELGDEGTHLTKATADGYYVAKNNAITGGTKTKITYDSKGLVTGGADLVASDIPALDAGKITSGTLPDARIASAATWNAKQNALSTEQLAAVNSGITATKVAKYDGYETSKQDTLTGAKNDAVNSGITAAKVAKYDGYEEKITTLEAKPGLDKVGTVTRVSAGTGLKVTGTASTTPVVEIDDSVVFIFNCGSSTEIV